MASALHGPSTTTRSACNDIKQSRIAAVLWPPASTATPLLQGSPTLQAKHTVTGISTSHTRVLCATSAVLHGHQGLGYASSDAATQESLCISSTTSSIATSFHRAPRTHRRCMTNAGHIQAPTDQTHSSQQQQQSLQADAGQVSECDDYNMLLQQFNGNITDAQAEVTRKIRVADSVKTLQLLFETYAPLLNAIHICAHLTRLKQLITSDTGRPAEDSELQLLARKGAYRDGLGKRRATQARLQAVMLQKEAKLWAGSILNASTPLISSFTMIEVAGCLHALARLGIAPSATWIADVLKHTWQLLPTASAAQLGITTWALAKLDLKPSDAFLDALCEVSIQAMQRMNSDSLTSTESSQATPSENETQTLTASTQDGSIQGDSSHAPGLQIEDLSVDAVTEQRQHNDGINMAGLIQQLADEQEDSETHTENSNAALVSLGWSLAKLKHAVPPDWSQAVLDQMSTRWSTLDSYSMANLCWGLATLGAQPSPIWLQELETASITIMGSANSYDLSIILWSLVTWRHRPTEQWLSQFFQASSHILPLSQPEHIARMLWCLATIQHAPPRAWLLSVIQQTQVQVFEFDAQAFGNMLWALARLKVRPPRDWIETVLLAIYEQGLDSWGPQELSNTMWALGRWRHAPEPAWLDLIWSEIYCQMARFSPQQQVNVLWAAVRMGQAPPEQCLAQLLKVSYKTRSSYTLAGSAMLLSCLAALEIPPGPRWSAAFYDSTLSHVQEYARMKPNATRSTVPYTQQMESEVRPDVSSSHEKQSQGFEVSDPNHASKAAGWAAEWFASQSAQHNQSANISSPTTGSVLQAKPVRPLAVEHTTTSTSTVTRPTFSHSTEQEHGDAAPALVCEKLISSVVTLKMQPPQEWVAALLGACEAHMSDMRFGNLVTVAYGMAMMGWNPSSGLVDAFVQQAELYLTRDPQQVNFVQSRKILLAASKLPGAQAAYSRWKQYGWLASALEDA